MTHRQVKDSVCPILCFMTTIYKNIPSASAVVSIVSCIVTDHFANKPFFCPNSSQHYTDLATIYTQSDTGKMHMSQYYAWIGLHKSEGNPLAHLSDWIWPNGQMNTLDAWSQDEPGNEDSCASVYYPARK